MANTLAGLRAELQRRAPRIKRAAQLLRVEFGPIESSYGTAVFDVKIWWKGGNATLYISEALAKHKPCLIMRYIIQNALKERNV